MYRPIRAGGWGLTVPAAINAPGARSGSDYWYLDRSATGSAGQSAMIRGGS